jgi:D-alanyl-D-alanine carboxypeptidase (penicillin-binding protein 5/6)
MRNRSLILPVLGFLLVILSLSPAKAVESFIIVDNQTGYIFSSKNPNSRMQVASLTKIATAVVVLDAQDLKMVSLNDRVTIPPQALSAGGVNPVSLQAGDQVSLRDLVYAALMASDNVAATAIAAHVGQRLPNPTRLDPVGNFVAHMNALARNLNMRRTLFLNPSGIDNIDGTLPFSTAADMARLTRYAYTEGDFHFFVQQKGRDISIHRGGETLRVRLTNTNQLLGQDGIDGVKTGRTNRAGDCLILSSWRKPEVIRHATGSIQNPRRIIVVLLKSRNRFGDGAALIRQGWSLYDAWAAGGRVSERSKML